MREAPAGSKIFNPDADDTSGDSDTRNTAGFERSPSDIGDTVGEYDVCETGAAMEGPVANGGDGVGYCIASGFAPWKLDKSDLSLVEQDASNTAVCAVGVRRLYSDCYQVGAVVEWTGPDSADARGNGDAGETAVLEGVGADRGEALVTLLGIATAVTLVNLNADGPMAVTGYPLIVLGMVTAPPPPM